VGGPTDSLLQRALQLLSALRHADRPLTDQQAVDLAWAWGAWLMLKQQLYRWLLVCVVCTVATLCIDATLAHLEGKPVSTLDMVVTVARTLSIVSGTYWLGVLFGWLLWWWLARGIDRRRG